VKVFFRLFLTQTNDTDYQTSTYPSRYSGGQPASPVVGMHHVTIPFFASGNYSSNPKEADYPDGPNTQDIASHPDGTWTYFGCFLNVYDPMNRIGGRQVNSIFCGTHNCLVAQIAYDDAPIVSTSAASASPLNSDKLAQRNLQITLCEGSGSPATHRIPQTFDLRPSPPLATQVGQLLNYPDELMISWGNTPLGSCEHLLAAGRRRRRAAAR
jgi:hypothetical protein